MLSFNTKNITDRIKERLFSKQDNLQGIKCSNITNEQLKQKADNYTLSNEEDSSIAVKFLEAQYQSLITDGVATDTHAIPIFLKQMVDEYSSYDSNNPYTNENVIRSHANSLSSINEQLGFEMGYAMTGSIFHWAKDGLNMFNTHQKDSILDTIGGYYSTTDRKGKRILLPEVNATGQVYRKRARGVGERDEKTGELLPLDPEKFKPGSKEFIDQQMAIEWEDILTETTINKDGTKTIKRKEWISSDELWQKYLDNPKLKLHDEYDGEGNLIRQVPKQIVQSLHSNIDGLEIRDAIKILKDREDVGKLWSKNDNEREEIIKSLKPWLKEDGTIDEEEYGKKTAKYKVFVEMLENREYPRTLNNTMQVVMNGRENMHKYLRVMYDGMAKNKLENGIHGADIDLSTHSGTMGKHALISEMSKMLVAREMHIQKTGKEPNLEELSSIMSIGISINKGEPVIRPSSKSPSFVQGVESPVYDAFQAGLRELALGVPNGVRGGEKDEKGEYIKGKEGFIQEGFLKDIFGMDNFNGVAKNVRDGGDVVISTDPDVTLNGRIKDMITKNFKGTELDDESLNYQIDRIRDHLGDYVKATYGGSKDPEKLNAMRKKSEDMRKNQFSQQTGKTEIHDEWFSAYKSIRNKLHRALDSDSSFSSDELDPASKSAGMFNKALDLFSALQVSKLENGATGFKGGSAFMFEDHHIYGKGDNQANTHFSLVFKPLHQGGLHATNYLVEDYDTALENLSMMKKYIEFYENNISNIEGSNFNIPEEVIKNVREMDSESLREKFDENGKFMPGEEMFSMTIYPTQKGTATQQIREKYGMGDNHTMFMYPSVNNEIIKHYDEQTLRNGDELISLWGNNSPVGINAGTILGESRVIRQKNPDYDPTNNPSAPELIDVVITPPHPLWSLEEGELKI